MIGSKLSHYEIVEQLGAGGMGVVYKARDLKLERFVAIKVLPQGRRLDAARNRRLFQEALAVSALNHPNIVTIHDIEQDRDLDFIVMEYVAGRTLDNLILPGGLDLSLALNYALQIAAALAATHAAGIVHRDLKPGNVMVMPSGQIKVLDFGLAKLDRSKLDHPGDGATLTVSLTEPGAVIGTVAYMSPEQGRGDSLDSRSDIFSFGVLLYEMLTGVRPFRGQHTAATLHQILYDQPAPVSRLKPGIPPAVDAAVARALEKDRDRRYLSVGEMARDLLSAAPNPSQAPGLPLSTLTIALPPPGRRLPRFAVPAALALALAFSGIAAWRWSSARSTNQPGAQKSTLHTPYDFTREGQTLLARYDRKGSIDAATASFRKAIALDANYAPGYAGASQALWRKFREEKDPVWLEQSRRNAEAAVRLDPQLAAAHVALAVALIESGKPDEARREIASALTLDPANAAAHDALTRIAQQKADWTTAESEANQAVRLQPGDWYLHSQLASALNAAGRYPEAEKAVVDGLKLTPDNFVLHRQLSVIYHQQGEFAKAAAELQKCLEIQPSPNIYSNLGTLYFFQGLYQQAVASLEKAVQLGANDPMIWGNLGDAYRWTPDNAPKAQQAFIRAVQLTQDQIAAKPADPTLRSRLAVYLAKLGRRQEAEQELAWLEKLPSRNASLLFRMVLAYEIAGNRAQALITLEAALKAGYSLVEIKKEPELANLRKDARYHRMLARRGL